MTATCGEITLDRSGLDRAENLLRIKTILHAARRHRQFVKSSKLNEDEIATLAWVGAYAQDVEWLLAQIGEKPL